MITYVIAGILGLAGTALLVWYRMRAMRAEAVSAVHAKISKVRHEKVLVLERALKDERESRRAEAQAQADAMVNPNGPDHNPKYAVGFLRPDKDRGSGA